MPDDGGNLSIDFLAGMTLFMIAIIWVATMIPGLLIGLQSRSIDYDAVAYRTGVILIEDSGMPANPPWEIKDDLQKDEIERFGLTISKETPNILKFSKVERFFCSTSFSYPDDYQHRVIFGDRPYRFNISLTTFDGLMNNSVGDIKPDGYGYIRRLVKLKYPSNATIQAPNYRNSGPSANVTTHIFSLQINCTHMIWDERNPAYQINPLQDQIMINVTNLSKAPVFWADTNSINLTNIKIYRQNPAQPLVQVRTFDDPYIDGGSATTTLPATIVENVSVIFPAGFFYGMATDNTNLYINYTFTLNQQDNFFNNSFTLPYQYDYSPNRVTQPKLIEGVLEVAVW
ncbi:MAG: hypothetical protein OS112_00875 [Methanoregula sp.]|nr:MAG: hypothetical protein OS112_00875 [Methanoregula sp.]